MEPALLWAIARLSEYWGPMLGIHVTKFALLAMLPLVIANANLHRESLLLRAIQTVTEAAWMITLVLTLVELKEMSFVHGLERLLTCIIGCFVCVMLQLHPGFASYPLLVREIVEPPPHLHYRQISRCRGG